MDHAAFGVSEHQQGFHSQQRVDADSRVALPASLPPLLSRTAPPTGPEDDPTEAPEAYATGEFSFPDTEDDEMTFLAPPSARSAPRPPSVPPPASAPRPPSAPYPVSAPDAVVTPLRELFHQPLGNRPTAPAPAAPPAPVEVTALAEAAPAERVRGLAPQGPAIARRIWRARLKQKSD